MTRGEPGAQPSPGRDLPAAWTLPPPGLTAGPPRDDTWEPWLDGLPRLVTDVLADWDLTPSDWGDGGPSSGGVRHGECAVVVPVRTADGEPAALKVGWPHPESRHEHLALGRWGGRDAVTLLRADPRRESLLLERAGPTDLDSLPDLEACAVVGSLYRSLHVRATPQLTHLSQQAADWADRLARLPRDAPLPRRLVEQAVSLCRAFATDPGTDGTLLHTDLHGQNVLASPRGWLVIDPKPVSGDPAYEPAPLLWNRWDDVVASRDVRGHVRRRLDVVLDASDLDPDRVRDWVVVREVVNVLWCLEAIHARGDRLDDGARAWITTAVTIAKAVQP